METSLINAGLSEHQAEAYLYLLKHGDTTPPRLASDLGLSRTNAYKVLDQLVEYELATKKEVKKKFRYFATSPLSLSNLVAEQRNIATKREEAVREIMKNLLNEYRKHSVEPDVKVVSGRDQVINAYRQQLALKQNVYFIRSRADIPSLGFESMHEIRTQPERHGMKRFGITPDIKRGPTNPDSDTRSGLTRTWMRHEDYNAPVEWSICGDTLLIVVFGDVPHAISITNATVAMSILQLWHLLDSCLRQMPYYKGLPRTNC